MSKLFATGNSEISSREKRNMERARKVAVTGQEEPSKVEPVREMSTAALW